MHSLPVKIFIIVLIVIVFCVRFFYSHQSLSNKNGIFSVFNKTRITLILVVLILFMVYAIFF